LVNKLGVNLVLKLSDSKLIIWHAIHHMFYSIFSQQGASGIPKLLISFVCEQL
jgi:hypothetical protein